MLYRLKMRIYAEITNMRASLFISLFTVISFFIAGFICSCSLSDGARALIVCFMFGSSPTVFSAFFALFWKRLVLLLLCCASGMYAVLSPILLCLILSFELTFCLAWGCALSVSFRSAVAVILIIIPATVFVLCTARALAYTFQGYVLKLKERRIRKTLPDTVAAYAKTAQIFASSFFAICCAGSLEAVAAAIVT